ncbi:MAG TPA: hypothetical protein VFJ94_12655 [Intrasporangium sp.]|uniref:hypothetical protein n=1 Tax=Intrasporangium sp. TaxID=1925024 RepID=UPI002D774036|nr:hypothetical protein [Intrasporangium sp.]HET7399361.1 hypothetical protein [Intrasporangium sp.]
MVLGIVALAVIGTGMSSASAHEERRAVANGGFETGTLTGWRTDELGIPGDGWSAASGTTSPVAGFPVPGPPRGTWQAVVDQLGPGSHVLYQDIKVDEDDTGLSLILWYTNGNGAFFTPRSLSPQVLPNQQLRVDLMRPQAPIRSMAPGDILATIFRTRVGDPASIPPRVLRQDLSRFEDRTVRLRIAEVDNQLFFQAGVDAVRVVEDEDHAWPRHRADVRDGAAAPSVAPVQPGPRYQR